MLLTDYQTLDINENLDSPLVIKVSFNKLLSQYENLIKADNDFIAANARRVLEIADNNPILREGFSDLNLLNTYEKEIEEKNDDEGMNECIETLPMTFEEQVKNLDKKLEEMSTEDQLTQQKIKEYKNLQTQLKNTTTQ